LQPQAEGVVRNFRAFDPWHANAEVEWAIFVCRMLPNVDPDFRHHRLPKVEWAKVETGTKWYGIGWSIAIASADGRYHLLPRRLVRPWLTGAVRDEALPALIRRLEPALERSDFALGYRTLWIVLGYGGGILGLLLPAGFVFGGSLSLALDEPRKALAENWDLVVTLALASLAVVLALRLHLKQLFRDREVAALVRQAISDA